MLANILIVNLKKLMTQYPDVVTEAGKDTILYEFKKNALQRKRI